MLYYDYINLSDRESFKKNILMMMEHVDNYNLDDLHEKEYIKDYRFDNADYSYCIYNVCIEPSRNEFSMEQYYYVVAVWCIFSCDSNVAYCT